MRAALAGTPRPIVGAIRWDAWTGGEVTAQVERTLGPRKYHDRLPWFAEVISDDKVRIDGSPQEVMDREISFAADAGLDYWAFLLYEEPSSMSKAIKQYLKSAQRGRINFCVILHNAFGVSTERWPAERDRAVALLKEPGYQTVLGGRPLVYAFQVKYQGAFPADRLAEFRRAAEQAGLNPYLVFMGWDPAGDFARQFSNGFDTVSAYAHPGAQSTFAQLAQSLENGPWRNAAGANAPYVPLATTGWDKQPRKDHPVSWEQDHDYHRQSVFPSTATPEEIAAHLDRAVRFVQERPKICVANAVIVYAWNEHDEGGWLSPTWAGPGKPNTGRLDAIRKVLRPGKKMTRPWFMKILVAAAWSSLALTIVGIIAIVIGAEDLYLCLLVGPSLGLLTFWGLRRGAERTALAVAIVSGLGGTFILIFIGPWIVEGRGGLFSAVTGACLCLLAACLAKRLRWWTFITALIIWTALFAVREIGTLPPEELVIADPGPASSHETYHGYHSTPANGRRIAQLRGTFSKRTRVSAALFSVRAGLINCVAVRECWRHPEGPVWENLKITYALTDEEGPDGKWTTLVSKGEMGRQRGYGQVGAVANNLHVVDSHLLTGNLRSGEKLIVYAEGDEKLTIDRAMTIEEFARKNKGNYLVVAIARN